MKTKFLIVGALMASMNLMAQPIQNEKVMSDSSIQIPKQGRGSSKVEYIGQSIDKLVYDFMEEQGIPGLTLAIVQAPYIPRVVGYGVSDAQNAKLASAKTIWPVGPISQGFAAVAVVQLKEKGKLQLEDNISKYLKKLPEKWQNITIKQLMQHSSGLVDYRDIEGFDITKNYLPEELIASVSNSELAFASGTEVKQSATNFLLLAQVVESVSKQSYRDFVTKNQIEYLGLKQTYFAEDLGKVMQETLSNESPKHKLFLQDKGYISPAETSEGYIYKDSKLVAAPKTNNQSLKGFSDIWASAENISHWDIALAGGVLINDPANRALIYSPTTLDSRKVVPAMAGWQFYNHNGLMDIKGNVTGHSAFLSRFTDASELVCVTLLGNKEGVDFTVLARQIAAAFDNKLGSGINENALYTYESQFSVDETMQRLEDALTAMQMPIFAKIDHAKNAKDAGLDMKASKVIVFGSPKVGTALMVENPSIALNLPLKIAVYEDANGSVWATFQKLDNMTQTYPLENQKVLGNMKMLLEKLVKKSVSIY